MAPQDFSSQSVHDHVNSASGQVGEDSTALSNPSVSTSAPPKCATPQPLSPLDPVCTHETALRTTEESSKPKTKPKTKRPTVDTRAIPPPPSEATPTSPWLPSPSIFARSRAATVCAAPIGRLDETTVQVEVELSSEAAKKAEKSLLWRIRK